MKRKRISKRRMARRNATKVVMTARPNERPILVSEPNKTGIDLELNRVDVVSLDEISLNQELFIV
jgi:hypothetical protein